MYETEDLPQAEIAEKLQISLSGAKSRIQRGRRQLEELFRSCCKLELDRRGNVLESQCSTPGCWARCRSSRQHPSPSPRPSPKRSRRRHERDPPVAGGPHRPDRPHVRRAPPLRLRRDGTHRDRRRSPPRPRRPRRRRRPRATAVPRWPSPRAGVPPRRGRRRGCSRPWSCAEVPPSIRVAACVAARSHTADRSCGDRAQSRSLWERPWSRRPFARNALRTRLAQACRGRAAGPVSAGSAAARRPRSPRPPRGAQTAPRRPRPGSG